MQTTSMTPARIMKPSAVRNPEGMVVVPGVKPRKVLIKDAAAMKTTTAAMTGPMIASMTEYNMLLKMGWSPVVSAMFFTATSIKTSPTMSRTRPELYGAQNSSPDSKASMDPIPPSVFAWLREAMLSATVSE